MKKKTKWSKRRGDPPISSLAKPVDPPTVCAACVAGQHDQCALMGGQRCGCTHAVHQEYPDPIEVGLHVKKHGPVVVPPTASKPDPLTPVQAQGEISLFPPRTPSKRRPATRPVRAAWWFSKMDPKNRP